MKSTVISLSAAALFVLILSDTPAQMQPPVVRWHFTAIRHSDSVASLFFTASLEEGWHLYTSGMEKSGVIPVTITFAVSNHYTPIGTYREESTPVLKYDRVFGRNLGCYENIAIFSQRISVQGKAVDVQGSITSMLSNDVLCLRYPAMKFTIRVPDPPASPKAFVWRE